jgi:AcrR family transcriptional regulator
MQGAKSRREMYSEATRAALLEQATLLFAARGYAATSLEDVAAAIGATRGAVYHHFAGKQALFEAVLDEQGTRALAEISAAAANADPRAASLAALDAYLDKCCDPTYGRLVWQEGPMVLGWHRWREFEERYGYGIVERFVRALMDAGYLERRPVDSVVRFAFWILGGAGLAVAETPAADRQRVREEWGHLIRRSLDGLRTP